MPVLQVGQLVSEGSSIPKGSDMFGLGMKNEEIIRFGSFVLHKGQLSLEPSSLMD